MLGQFEVHPTTTKYIFFLTDNLVLLSNSYCLQKTSMGELTSWQLLQNSYKITKGILYKLTLFLFSFSNPGVSVSGGKTTETATLYGLT